MKISSTKQDDGSLLVIFTHKELSVERQVTPILNAKGKLDKTATDERIASIGQAIENKIDEGHITAYSLRYTNLKLESIYPATDAVEETAETDDKG